MTTGVLGLVVILAIILFSMVLHELAHGAVAYLLGDTTAKDSDRLTLNPLKHLDPFMSVLLPVLLYIGGGPIFGGAKPVPINTQNLKFREWGFALVALAGPMTNFLLALIGFLVGYWTGWLVSADFIGYVSQYFVMINLGFAVFNMLPIPPLDGSRILYAISPDGVRRILNSIESFGIWLVLILVAVFGVFFSSIMGGAMDGILRFFYFIVGVA